MYTALKISDVSYVFMYEPKDSDTQMSNFTLYFLMVVKLFLST